MGKSSLLFYHLLISLISAKRNDALEQITVISQWLKTGGITRHLFAHNAEQGFAFIDSLQRPFYMVPLNPLFGAPNLVGKKYIVQYYLRMKKYLYVELVERRLELLVKCGSLHTHQSNQFFPRAFSILTVRDHFERMPTDCDG